MHKELAKITSTMLGVEDHGILTAMLHVSYEAGSSQGIGGYALDEPIRDENKEFIERRGTAEGMQFVVGVIRACGVESWEKLPGTMIYVLRESDSWGAKVLGIQSLGFAKSSEPFLFASLWPAEASA